MNRKNEKAITLIALVVTIVVLLILAGVTISMLAGENGIITQAQNAKDQTEIARIKEEAQLVKSSIVLDSFSDSTGTLNLEKTVLLNALKEHFNGTIGSSKVTTSNGKYDILVDNDLKITVVKREGVADDEIRITAVVTEGTENTNIDLYFEIGGIRSFEEYTLYYINTNIYPEIDNATGLEDKIEELTKEKESPIVFDDATRSQKQQEASDAGCTYEEYLRMEIFQIQMNKLNYEQQDTMIFSKIMYEYYCECLDEEKYTEEEELEDQVLRIFEYYGTFEEAVSEIWNTTEEELKQAATNSGTEYEDILRGRIAIYLAQEKTINVNVSNDDSFKVILIEEVPKSYTVTSDGIYTFTAEFEGRKGKTDVIVGDVEIGDDDEDEDITSDPNGWEVAWTYSADTGWSELITNEGETALQGSIVAKFYNTGKTISPQAPESFGGTILDPGPEYKVLIEGSGEMGSLKNESTMCAWQDYGLLGNKSSTEFAYSLYVTEAYIGENITNISDYAFYACIALEEIHIPDTVESIGYDSLFMCHKLQYVIIPEKVTTISDGTFSDCNSLKEITIPEGVTSIGHRAFKCCYALTEIIIPDSVTTIGTDAFFNCTGLTGTVKIPDGVTEIAWDTFYGCTGITGIEIPDSVITIGQSAFKGCTSLKTVEMPDSITSVSESAFWGCSNLTSVTLSLNISKIESCLFRECTSLETIIIPEGVTYIDSYAFQDCTSLKNIRIPNNVTTLNPWVFKNCTSLESVELSTALATIESELFYNCTSLKSIVIPASVNNISTSAFENCSSLMTVTIMNTGTYVFIGESAFMGLPSGSTIYVKTQGIKDNFTDGTEYDSTKTTIKVQ